MRLAAGEITGDTDRKQTQHNTQQPSITYDNQNQKRERDGGISSAAQLMRSRDLCDRYRGAASPQRPLSQPPPGLHALQIRSAFVEAITVCI